jgi:hypothetical protein
VRSCRKNFTLLNKKNSDAPQLVTQSRTKTWSSFRSIASEGWKKGGKVLNPSSQPGPIAKLSDEAGVYSRHRQAGQSATRQVTTAENFQSRWRRKSAARRTVRFQVLASFVMNRQREAPSPSLGPQERGHVRAYGGHDHVDDESLRRRGLDIDREEHQFEDEVFRAKQRWRQQKNPDRNFKLKLHIRFHRSFSAVGSSIASMRASLSQRLSAKPQVQVRNNSDPLH